MQISISDIVNCRHCDYYPIEYRDKECPECKGDAPHIKMAEKRGLVKSEVKSQIVRGKWKTSKPSLAENSMSAIGLIIIALFVWFMIIIQCG